jgi:hypothetical protein
MTSWQDQQMRGGAGGAAVDPSTGAPMSRRAAREAERRAAEALAEKQPHPSGVVDFETRGHIADFAPDQEFNVGDTQDIWKALTGARRQDAAPQPGPDAFRNGFAETPAPAAPPESASVNGELLDRVRDAVLRRSAEQQAPASYQQPQAPAAYQAPQQPTYRAPAPQAPAAFPQQPAAFGQQPSAFPQQPAAFPQAPSAFPRDDHDLDDGLTRRQRRERDLSDVREDGLPSQLFADQGRAPFAPQQAAPAQPAGFDGYDYEDDGYYDEPYAPEPTIAIATHAAEAPRAQTNPVGLQHAFGEPTGDDALTFSSPIPSVAAEPRDEWADAQADPAFIEPSQPYAAQPRSAFSAPTPAQAPFVDPQAAAYPQPPQASFVEPQLGPPSEVTDLAGFEALIRKARQQPAEPQAAPQAPALAWADEEDVQDGFTGLLSRSVQGSHGSAGALILPNDPQPDLTQALDANGDIFITGSMNLSRSLSTTGASSDLYDSQEIDRLYEAAQDEPAAGVQPVRASKAVSGAPHDRRFAGAPKRRGNVLPTVLAIVAGAMAVGVVTLLVGSWVLKLF